MYVDCGEFICNQVFFFIRCSDAEIWSIFSILYLAKLESVKELNEDDQKLTGVDLSGRKQCWI